MSDPAQRPRVPILSFPTPKGRADILFYEVRDSSMPENTAWVYGEAHPAEEFKTTHKLVYVRQDPNREPGSKWQQWFYAAERFNQKDYNANIEYPWPDSAYPVVTRQAVLKRDTFTPLAAGALDPAYASLTLVRQRMFDLEDATLRSLFVAHEAVFERLPGYVNSSTQNVASAEQVTYTQRVKSLNPGTAPAAPVSGTWTRLVAEVKPTEDAAVSEWTVTYQRLHKVMTFVTPQKDVVFYELHDGSVDTAPVYGTAHPDLAYNNYKLVHVAAADDSGMQKWYYVMAFADQHKYNFEYNRGTPGNQWPTLKQVFLILRDAFDASTVFDRPTLTNINFAPFTLISRQLTRTGDQILDGLFFAWELVYEHQTVLTGYEIDADTGISFPVTIEKVPHGSPGASVGADGRGSEVQPLNQDWAIKTTRTLVGMATETRSYESTDTFTWPPVLLGIELDVVLDPTRTQIVTVLVNEVWKNRGYTGPCRMVITETWSLAPPTIIVPPQMILTPIVYDGLFFKLDVQPCLHPTLSYFETTGTESSRYAFFAKNVVWVATNYLDWPDSQVVRAAPQPFRGGYLTKSIEVFSPKGNRAA